MNEQIEDTIQKLSSRNKYRPNYGQSSEKKNDIICRNCGEKGHSSKSCSIPITSWGIILVKIEGFNMLEINHDLHCENIENIENIENTVIKEDTNNIGVLLVENIKFLLVSRKHSLGYREFINGKYKLSQIDYIVFLIKQMLPSEIENIKKYQHDFDSLWNDLWGSGSSNKKYITEYERAKKQYNNLVVGESAMKLEDILSWIKTAPSYMNPEYGFPKGRKNNNESDIDCAVREFTEETGLLKDDIRIIPTNFPIVENLTGTDGVEYRHIYYLAESITDNLPIISDVEGQKNEIGDVGFYSYFEALEKIRVYHIEKKDIIRNITEYYLKILTSKIGEIDY